MAKKSSGPSSRLIIWGVVALAVVGVLIIKSSQVDPGLAEARKDPAVGQPMSVLDLEPLTGRGDAVSLDSLRGKVVAINFWGTNCEPCVKEFPRLAEVWDRNRGIAEFKFVSVSTIDAPENVETLRKQTETFLKSHGGLAMPTYADVMGKSRDKLGDLLKEADPEYPITLVFDRKGVVRAVWRGYADGEEHQVEQMISTLLAEAQSP
jgi:cytochrome c biogenesis protein CcmG, thiol:disulfide interchange protein DsbE